MRAAATFVLAAIVCTAEVAGQDARPKTSGEAREVQLQVVGCVSGDVLTETTLTRNPASGLENPARRWKLKLSKEQRRALDELRHRQVEVSGVAAARDLEESQLGVSRRAGPGRIYIGADSRRYKRDAAPRASTPVPLVVDTIAPRAEPCR